MSYTDRSAFLPEYRKLCEKHQCYVDTGYGHPLYLMEILYPVDRQFESTMDKLELDVG